MERAHGNVLGTVLTREGLVVSVMEPEASSGANF